MQRIPGGVIQVSEHSRPPTYQTGRRAASDDDLYAWCSHLLYRPGELSLRSLSSPEGYWPSRCDEDGYTQACPSLRFNKPSL